MNFPILSRESILDNGKNNLESVVESNFDDVDVTFKTYDEVK